MWVPIEQSGSYSNRVTVAAVSSSNIRSTRQMEMAHRLGIFSRMKRHSKAPFSPNIQANIQIACVENECLCFMLLYSAIIQKIVQYKCYCSSTLFQCVFSFPFVCLFSCQRLHNCPIKANLSQSTKFILYAIFSLSFLLSFHSHSLHSRFVQCILLRFRFCVWCMARVYPHVCTCDYELYVCVFSVSDMLAKISFADSLIHITTFVP